VATHPPTKAKTTFGDSAAELVVEDGGAPARKGRSMTLVVAALLGLGGGGVAISRLRAPHTDVAPPSAAAGSAPSSAPAPSPPIVVPPSAANPTPPPTSAKADPPAAPPSSAHAPVGPVAPAASTRDAKPVGKKGQHHAVEVASAAAASGTEPPAAPASPSDVAADSLTVDYSGIWEGPWTDTERHQTGRLYLQVASGGAANGWLSNATAGRSYRLTGRAERPGDYALVCECPVNQGFNVRVALHQADGSELKGRVSLSTASGVFGQSHVVLRRSAAR
jgi:hypothetical protein